MEGLGRILIADDEGVFLDSTADLLREDGYSCDCVADGPAAAERLRQGGYDLLIADIRMPGNPDLELVREINGISDGLQVILVTGYPSMDSAIRSVGLPVCAYLVKPIDIDELRSSVRSGIERSRMCRAVKDAEVRLREYREKLIGMVHLLRRGGSGIEPLAVEAFVNLTLRNIVAGLADLKQVTEAAVGRAGEREVCSLVRCPRLESLDDTLRDTIRVLEKTKRSFRSKELGELRLRLENLLGETAGN